MRSKAAILAIALTGAGARAAKSNSNVFEYMDVFQLEYAFDPQISPDGSRVVYVRDVMDTMKDRARSELWIVNVDGSGHRRLTGGDGQESSPRWSPDGKKVAYVSRSGGSSEIHVLWTETGGTADLRTPLSKAKQFYHALKRHGARAHPRCITRHPGATEPAHREGGSRAGVVRKIPYPVRVR